MRPLMLHSRTIIAVITAFFSFHDVIVIFLGAAVTTCIYGVLKTNKNKQLKV
jgi:hypothetical protein